MVEKAITSFLEEQSIAGVTIGVALSGGADSVALLHGLDHISQTFGLTLCAIHVNYHLRGDSSERDELFVRELCNSKNIELFLYQEDLSREESGVEEKARHARYDCFGELLASGVCDYIATAHSENDQAETLLFRLARGTGVAGLRGMEPVRKDGIIHPLLQVNRREILDYLKKGDLAWREDKSNTDLQFSRNRIRHVVLPALAQINSEVVPHIAQLAETLQKGQEGALRTLLKRVRYRSTTLVVVERHEGLSSQEAYDLLTLLGLRTSHKICESLAENSGQTGSQTLLSGDWSMHTLKDKLCFCSHPLEISRLLIAQSGVYVVVPGLWEFSVEIDSESVHLPLHIRPVSEHDMLMRAGDHNERSILSLLKKQGYSSWERKQFPLICTAEGVPCWLPGFGGINGTSEEDIKIAWMS